MLFEVGLFAYLSTQGTLGVGTGATARIYPLVVPQGTTLPALTYRRAQTTPDETLGDDGPSEIRMELTFWGTDYLTLKQAAKTLRSLLRQETMLMGDVRIAGVQWLDEQDVYEESLLIPGVQLDFAFTVNDD